MSAVVVQHGYDCAQYLEHQDNGDLVVTLYLLQATAGAEGARPSSEVARTTSAGTNCWTCQQSETALSPCVLLQAAADQTQHNLFEKAQQVLQQA